MILKEEIFQIGTIGKPHGLKGELSFSTTFSILEEVDVPFIFLEPQGLIVPFYIESVRMKTDNAGIIKLERVNTEEQAAEYAGLDIFLPKIYLDEVGGEELDVNYFIGFEIVDVKFGKVGQIVALDDSTANVLFEVNAGDNELLIPVADEFIVEIDHEKHILIMDFPAGLLDL